MLLPEAAFDVRRASNPGSHEITAVARGTQSQKLEVELTEGAERTLNLTFRPVKSPVSHLAEPQFAARPFEPVHDRRTNPTTAYVALGVGGLGLTVGTVAGVLALRKRSDLTAVCHAGACPPSAQPDINAYHSMGLVSGFGFGLGFVAASTGVVLLQVGRVATPTQDARQFELHLQVSPARVGFEGTFQ